MANPEHVNVVMKGAEAVEEWRQKHRNDVLDLSDADLSKVDLSMADLSDALLSRVDLSIARLFQVNLSRTLLSETNFLLANLAESNMTEARLYFTNLNAADLTKGNLSNTTLAGTNFHHTALIEVNFTGASMISAIIVNCDLSQCIGLESIKHFGPSSVGIDTLVKSFRGARNRLTPELELFFLNAGVPKELLDALPAILAEVKYCSCFIAYGQPDLAFAGRLAKDLIARGVSCWLYDMDATPGKRVWGEITQRRREAEKMIVLCSAKSLIRDGVLKEIEEQIDEEPNKIVPISLDDTWRQDGFVIRRGKREDLKTFLLDRTYADFSDESKYNDSLKRLLKGIRRA
jgi:hypothetical protein